MVAGTARLCVAGISTVFAALAILVLAAVWRVSDGPVRIAALTPVLEDALSAFHADADVRIGETWLEWAGWSGTLDLRLKDARLVDPDGRTIANIPRLDVVLAAKDLAFGHVEPVSIKAYEPGLHLLRGPAGFELSIVGEGGETSFQTDQVKRLISPPGTDAPGGRLERIEVIDAMIIVEDRLRGRQWTVPASAARVWRVDGGIDGDVVVDVLAAGEWSDLALLGKYRTEAGVWELAAAFGDLRPDSFAALDEVLAPLSVADVPLSGTITVTGTEAGDVSGLGFDLSSGAGTLALPGKLFAAPEVSASPVPVAVESFAVRGRLDAAEQVLDVSAFDAAFAPETTIQLPGSTETLTGITGISGRGSYEFGSRRMAWQDVRIDVAKEQSLRIGSLPDLDLPLRSLTFSGTSTPDEQQIEISPLVADVKGTTVTAAVTVSGSADEQFIQATLLAGEVALDDIDSIWPVGLLEGARSWVTERMSDGIAKDTRIDLSVLVTPAAVELDSFSGSLTIENATVAYIPSLPPVRGASAIATLGSDRVTFSISSGRSEGVTVDQATVDLVNLGRDDERAVVDVIARGSLPDVLEIIDRPPLRYADAVGIEPRASAGEAEVRLQIGLPLLDDVVLADVDILAEANLSDVGLANIVLGKDLDDGRLALRVDKSGIDVTGSARLGPIEGLVLMRENFSPSERFRRSVRIDVPDAELTAVQTLFTPLSDLPPDVLGGSVLAGIEIRQRFDGTGRVDADLDFANASISVPFFGWSKVHGAPARARIVSEFDQEAIRRVRDFSIDAEGLHLKGSAEFTSDQHLEQVRFDRVFSGRTEASGTVLRDRDGNLDIAIRGRSIDLEPVLADLSEVDMSAVDSDGWIGDVALTVDLGEVWIDTDRSLKSVNGTIARERGLIRSAALSAKVDDGTDVRALIQPSGASRSLTFSADNAGLALRSMGLFDGMNGGKLRLDGAFDDNRPSRPLVGTLRVTDYHIKNAPALAKVLGTLALTEIRNTLRGDGLSFNVLEVPFAYMGDRITIQDAHASSAALGFTAEGTVDFEQETLDLNGTVIPIYALNSALGRVPIIGFIFNGGDKRGGLLAANFTASGPFDDYSVMVNPLSALTPGVFRRMFDVFDAPDSSDPGSSVPGLETAGGEQTP